MKVSIVILACAAALAGCGYAQQLQENVDATGHRLVTSPAQLRAERDAADDATCRGYGAMPETPVYVQCRVGLDQARASRAAASANGAAQRPLNCTSLALGGGLTSTNCN